MPKAVITATPNGKAIRIVKDMGMLDGLPCGDTTIIIEQVNRQMSTDSVELVSMTNRKINIPVGEVEDIGGVTDLDTTMKIRSALITVLGW